MTVFRKLNHVDNTKPLGILSAAVEKRRFICSPLDTPKGLWRGYFLR